MKNGDLVLETIQTRVDNTKHTKQRAPTTHLDHESSPDSDLNLTLSHSIGSDLSEFPKQGPQSVGWRVRKSEQRLQGTRWEKGNTSGFKGESTDAKDKRKWNTLPQICPMHKMSWKPVKKNREGTQIPQGGMTNYLQRIEAHDDLTEDNVHGTIIWNVEPYPHKTSNIDTNLSKIDANLPWHDTRSWLK